MELQRVVSPVAEKLLCAGCECTEPCLQAHIASGIDYAERVAQNRLGDILDFTGSLASIRELKAHIASAMQGVSVHGADSLLKKLCILPQPSSFTVATTAHGYAILFVVGESYITHPVVVQVLSR